MYRAIKVYYGVNTNARHPKIGWLMMFPSENQFAKFMASMVTSLAKVDYRQADSLESVLNILKRMDDSLPSVDDMMTQVTQ